MSDYTTELGSLDDYRKGGVHIINDDPRNYVFSNVFEVAGKSAPFERVCVAKNLEYAIEIMRVEGAIALVHGWPRRVRALPRRPDRGRADEAWRRRAGGRRRTRA